MKQIVAQKLKDLRERSPLVHNITNFVVMNNTANAILAVGASPMMVHGHQEVEAGVTISNSLVINIGTVDDYWAESMKKAAACAKKLNKPWVLDPVGAGLSSFRDGVLYDLLEYEPTVIRGNASEIMTLDQFSDGETKGVDSTKSSFEALSAAIALNQKYGAIVCISGEVDYIISKEKIITVRNGSPLMTKVTGLGCSSTAVIGAFLGLHSNPFEEAIAGVSILSLAGELAHKQSNGPGSLQMHLLDILYQMDDEILFRYLQVDEYSELF